VRSIPPKATSKVPTWLLLPVALVAGTAGYAVSPGPAHAPEPSPSTASSSSLATAAHAPPPVSPLASASAAPPLVADAVTDDAVTDTASLLGRLKTIEALAPKDRTIATSLELERGHVDLALREVDGLEAELGGKLDPVALARLRTLAEDDAVAPAVLAALARHPSAAAADLLHQVSIDPRASDAVRYLAGDLLALPSVRGAVSNALLVTLDLAAAKSCPAVERLARRAQNSGDDRAVPALRALESEVGCGPKRKDDCYRCLRGSTLLFEAREAAASRAYVAPWKLRSP
jgi:hypothetical protein